MAFVLLLLLQSSTTRPLLSGSGTGIEAAREKETEWLTDWLIKCHPEVKAAAAAGRNAIKINTGGEQLLLLSLLSSKRQNKIVLLLCPWFHPPPSQNGIPRQWRAIHARVGFDGQIPRQFLFRSEFHVNPPLENSHVVLTLDSQKPKFIISTISLTSVHSPMQRGQQPLGNTN